MPLTRWSLPTLQTTTDGRTAPGRKPVGSAVFITDAITPVAGETLLALLLKRMSEENDKPEGQLP
ncbi:hypothetical protein A8B82_09245 [Sulfitobacter sp. EhC04]|nr:hypothetical protein A8B82_09245 [Sulfitobacter sp. EhC04]